VRISKLEVLDLGAGRDHSIYAILETDDGLSGVAEVGLTAGRGTGRETLLAWLRSFAPRHVIGSDPFETEKLVNQLASEELGRMSRVTATAISLIEVACWDLVGKALKTPLYRLFGGAVRDRIKAYASHWAPADLGFEGLSAAARRMTAKGYQALAFDPFGPVRDEPSRSEIRWAIRRCEVVRAAVGPDVEILIEMDGRFVPAVAIQFAGGLERVEPTWISEPVPYDRPGAQVYEKVGAGIRWPVAAGFACHDRSDALELLERRACDVLHLALAHCGGFLEMRKIGAMADAYSVPLALRNAPGSVATAASLHLAAGLSNFLMLESREDSAAEGSLESPARSSPSAEPAIESELGRPPLLGGYFVLPQGPGLGVSLDIDRLRQSAPPPS
jgi:galactonate dehydratase